MDANRYALAVGLLAGNALDVDDVFETVNAGDLALTALVGTANDGNLVVLADWDRADLCLLSSQTLCPFRYNFFFNPSQTMPDKSSTFSTPIHP